MNYELWIVNYELWIMNCELWIVNYELWVVNCELFTLWFFLWFLFLVYQAHGRLLNLFLQKGCRPLKIPGLCRRKWRAKHWRWCRENPKALLWQMTCRFQCGSNAAGWCSVFQIIVPASDCSASWNVSCFRQKFPLNSFFKFTGINDYKTQS